MYVKPWFSRRSVARQMWRRLTLSFVLGLTSLTGLIALGSATPASASYVPSLSVTISISLVDPGDCTKHTFFVRVASDAGQPSGTAELISNGTVLGSAAVPAGGGVTLSVSSNALIAGTNKVTARFIPSAGSNWSSATASVVITNSLAVNCVSSAGNGSGPLIDTGMAPDQAPAGFPWWIVEAALCGLIAAGGFVVTRARASEQ
jgi:hypothetical protein